MRLFHIILLIFGLGVSSEEVDFDVWDIDEFALFPTLPIAAPWSEDEKCREDSRKLMINLKNKTFWAMQMWDSSAKTEFGVLWGNVYQGGNFDECLTIREPIISQYCVVTIRVEINGELGGDDDPYELDPKPTDSVWKKIKDSRVDTTKLPRDNATWGLCVPASCTPMEIKKSILRHLDRVNAKFNGSIKYIPRIADGHCQTQESIEFSAGEIAFWCTSIFIAILVATSTTYDLLQKKWANDSQDEEFVETKLVKLFTSFSLKRNIPRMCHAEEKGEVKELNILYPLKYLTMIFIVVSHRIAYFFSFPLINYQTTEENLRSFHNMFIPHTDLLVDTFFFIGGMLSSFTLLSVYHKKFVNPLVVIVGRFIRIAPVYYLMVWFHTDGIYRVGTGPVWVVMKAEVENCHKNWWTNILFISNYVNIEESCMFHTWYIPCDVHLFILAIFLAICISKFEKIGLSITVLLTVVSAAVPGISTYYYHLFPLTMYYHYNLGTNVRHGLNWKYLYVPTHARATVYFVGFLAGYAIFKTKHIEKKINGRWVILNNIIWLALFFAPMYYGSLYYDPRKQYNVVEASLFAAFRRLSWAIGAFVFVLSYRFSVLPLVTFIVNSNFFVPFGKITYSVYVVHFYIFFSNMANMRIPYYYRYYDMVIGGLTDVLTVSFYGAVLYLSVELPFKVFFHELIFVRVIKKVEKKTEEKENRRTIHDVLAKQETGIPFVVSAKL